MSADSRSWPLQLVFLLMLIGGALGLIEPKLFSSANPPERTIAVWLMVGAVVIAVVLYVPLFAQIFGGVGTLLNATGMGTPANPAQGTLLQRIGALGEAIGVPANPPAGTLLQRIGAIADAVGSPANPQAGTLLARLANLEALGTAFGALNNPQAGT